MLTISKHRLESINIFAIQSCNYSTNISVTYFVPIPGYDVQNWLGDWNLKILVLRGNWWSKLLSLHCFRRQILALPPSHFRNPKEVPEEQIRLFEIKWRRKIWISKSDFPWFQLQFPKSTEEFVKCQMRTNISILLRFLGWATQYLSNCSGLHRLSAVVSYMAAAAAPAAFGHRPRAQSYLTEMSKNSKKILRLIYGIYFKIQHRIWL